MSALKKLRQQKQKERELALAQQHAEEEEENDDEDVGGGPNTAAAPNPFDFLDEDDDAGAVEEENEEQDVEEEKPKKGKGAGKKGGNTPAPPVISGGGGGGKNKKKKNKKASKKNDADNADLPNGADDIDQLVETINELKAEDAANSESKHAGTSVFATQKPLFNPDSEIKRVFGASVLRMAREEEAEAAGRRRRPAGRTSGLRRLVLARQDDNWPAMQDRGLSLKLVRQSGGIKQFEFEYSEDYGRVQQDFDRVTASLDPQQIVYFLQRHPFHADALLQMATICLHHSENADASMLVERCVYVHERAFSPDFTFAEANCRLAWEHEPNSSFLCALCMHSRLLAKKGCPRTALEVAKLLISLCPSDPTATLVNLDYYALRSREYAWLLSCVTQFTEPDQIPLSVMPSFSFSIALAKAYLEAESAHKPLLSGGFAVAGGCIEPNDTNLQSHSASLLLQRALLLFPEALFPLLKKTSDKEPQQPRWQPIFSHKLFRGSSERPTATPYTAKLVNIFAERSASLWKPDKVLGWLFAHANALIQKIDKGEISPDVMRQYEQLRANAYRDTALPEKYRVLMPHEYSDAAPPALPAELLMGGALPQRPDDGYVRISQQELQGGNALMMFLRTLLPWVHVEEDDPEAFLHALQQHRQGGGGGGGPDGDDDGEWEM